MSVPLVSVLIPCYNAAPYLRATLESALSQTHPKVEVVVVDDGSTDGSLVIARSYEPRITVLSGPQRGASAARNLATQTSRGEWIQYLDADDLLLPEAISRRLEAVDPGRGDVACGDWTRISKGTLDEWVPGRVESADYRTVDNDPDLAVFKGFWAPPAALLYRRSLVESVGGWHPGLPVIQDARFLFDAAMKGGRFVHVPGDSAHYRQHAAMSLSSRSRTRFWADVLKNNREIEAVWNERGLMNSARKDAVGKAYSLGARVTFTIDRELYRANLVELQRFPGCEWSRYLRAANGLERVLGYPLAAGLMRLARPNQST
jgi:glycosyltransferase involved in cell wall biosynthesis